MLEVCRVPGFPAITFVHPRLVQWSNLFQHQRSVYAARGTRSGALGKLPPSAATGRNPWSRYPGGRNYLGQLGVRVLRLRARPEINLLSGPREARFLRWSVENKLGTSFLTCHCN